MTYSIFIRSKKKENCNHTHVELLWNHYALNQNYNLFNLKKNKTVWFLFQRFKESQGNIQFIRLNISLALVVVVTTDIFESIALSSSIYFSMLFLSKCKCFWYSHTIRNYTAKFGEKRVPINSCILMPTFSQEVQISPVYLRIHKYWIPQMPCSSFFLVCHALKDSTLEWAWTSFCLHSVFPLTHMALSGNYNCIMSIASTFYSEFTGQMDAVVHIMMGESGL